MGLFPYRMGEKRGGGPLRAQRGQLVGGDQRGLVGAAQEVLQTNAAYLAYCDAVAQTVEIVVSDPPIVSGNPTTDPPADPPAEQKSAFEQIRDFLRDVLTFLTDRLYVLAKGLLQLI